MSTKALEEKNKTGYKIKRKRKQRGRKKRKLEEKKSCHNWARMCATASPSPRASSSREEMKNWHATRPRPMLLQAKERKHGPCATRPAFR
jgi:ADP-heptose:LPS heptosyltransferase